MCGVGPGMLRKCVPTVPSDDFRLCVIGEEAGELDWVLYGDSSSIELLREGMVTGCRKEEDISGWQVEGNNRGWKSRSLSLTEKMQSGL